MKTSAAIVAFICLVASTSAFTAPQLATRAVGKPRKAAPKKAAPKKAVAKKAVAKKAVAKKTSFRPVSKAKRSPPPESKGYPTWPGAQDIQFPGFSGGGNKKPAQAFMPPDFSDPKLQIKRDPKFYAKAAKTRLTKKTQELVYDDGLTVLERKQRKTIPTFLTGSARSQADTSTIRKDIETDEYPFGLDADRFQLLFISVFGLFTLVGCLSGNLNF